MRLKYVVLKGFKAYKDETKVYFHPGANAIVGSNGSGKSSLLEAITLVVSEVYGKKTTDLKAYFHRGVRNSVLSAFVELCFDNSDRKIATIDKDEVRFRRTFHHSGAKKDELQVDGKRVTKAEFSSLLEAGGFSKSNPYYVIRQGKIIEMAEMTDEGRLKLLKDFSGVQVYEEKRALAAESLQSSRDVANQADEQMRDLEKRLSELEAQKAELLEYRRLVSSVEVYRLAINDLEAKNFQGRLGQLTSRLDEAEKVSRSLRLKLEEYSCGIEKTQSERQQIQSNLSQKDTEVADLSVHLNRLVEEQAMLEMQLQVKQRERDKRKLEGQRRQEVVTDQIKTAQTLKEKYHEVEEQLVELKSQKHVLTQEHSTLSAEMQLVRDKKERCLKFKSNTARKSHLEGEIRKLEALIESSRKELKKAQVELNQHRKRLDATQQEPVEQDLAALDSQVQSAQSKLIEADERKLRLLEEQGRIQDELHTLRKPTHSRLMIQRELDLLRQHVKDRSWRGLLSALYWDATVERDDNLLRIDNLTLIQDSFLLSETLNRLNPAIMCDEWRRGYEIDGLRIPGVLGPLWSLIRVPNAYRTAVAVAINVQLENVVCLNDSLASDIAAEMKKRRTDETINLSPLNQIKLQFGTQRPKYPPGVYVPKEDEKVHLEEVGCVPLVSVMEFPSFLLPVMMQVARKWLLVANSDEGQKYCDAGFDCVTLDGDKLSSKGTLQGGHIAPNGILHASENVRAAFSTLSGSDRRQFELTQRLEGLRRELMEVSERKRELDEAYSRLTNDKLAKKTALAKRQAQKDSLKATIERLVMETAAIEQRIQTATNAILQNRRVLLSNETETMTGEDVKYIETLDENFEALLKDIDKTNSEIDKLNREGEKLRKELHRVQDWLDRNSQEDVQGATDDTASECEVLVKRLEGIIAEKASYDEIERQSEESIECLRKALTGLKKQEESLRDQHERDSRLLHTLSQEIERIRGREFELRQKIKLHEENKAHLLSAGHFTQEDIDALKKEHSVQHLQDLLREGEKRLGDCPRVNEKAIEDLADFQAEFAEKQVEQEQLRKSLESVMELMRVLDERRSQTLRVSFDLVNTNLQLVFSTLVPGGRAKLVIKKLSDDKIAELIGATQSIVPYSNAPSNVESPSTSTTSLESSTQNSAYKVQVSGNQVQLGANGRDPQWDEVARGIEIKASFRPAESPDEQTHFFPIVALSGGQKTILALSLIFAMQRCDQAPFYVFDECDAALDEGYRSSIAKLIQSATDNSQFLITTFRRELCEICDRHFMVTTSDRVAQVKTVTKEQAVEMILREQQDGGGQQLMIDV